jgi:carbonic anhydrase/acetyltransferase-like protein (isoleucine patch superfamily)
MPRTNLVQRLLATAVVVGLAVAAAPAPAAAASFADPTAQLRGDVLLGDDVYVAPFARLLGRAHRIRVGADSNLQDSVAVTTRRGGVRLGERVILAHGSSVRGPATIGVDGSCEHEPCAAFVSFNARVDGAVVQRDAMVQALARVGPGVTIPSGRKVLPGRSVDTQAQVAGETEPVTEADREFVAAVIEVNVAFAKGYRRLARRPSDVRGIGPDPGGTDFNTKSQLPRLAGKPTRRPGFRNRVIGDVQLADDYPALRHATGARVSLRADEGEPFEIGRIGWMADETTVHALEGNSVSLGARGRFGVHSIVHGGATPFGVTGTGDDVRLGDGAVLFRSRAGDGAAIGARSLVQLTEVAAGAVVPSRTVVIGGVVAGTVEW